MKLFIQMLVTLVVILNMSDTHAQTSAQPQGPETLWRVLVVDKLGVPTLPCSTAKCEKALQDMKFRQVTVCLSRDPSTAGLFSRGDWRAAINPDDRSLCKEVLLADLVHQIVYLEAPVKGSAGYLARGQYIDCASDGGHSACSSEFFRLIDGNRRLKALDMSALSSAIEDSKMLTLLGQYGAELARQQAEEALLVYRTAYDNAVTLTDIQAFETRYASNDPDGLIPKLAERKRSLQMQQYRQRFEVMRTEDEIEAFISDYANEDPDGKLPQARRLLAETKNRAALEAKNRAALEANRKAEEKRLQQLENLERQIIWCKRQTAAAHSAIDRENQIGRVSGYVNKLTLRRAGEIIISCEESVPRHYAEYRKSGGKRALAELK